MHVVWYIILCYGLLDSYQYFLHTHGDFNGENIL